MCFCYVSCHLKPLLQPLFRVSKEITGQGSRTAWPWRKVHRWQRRTGRVCQVLQLCQVKRYELNISSEMHPSKQKTMANLRHHQRRTNGTRWFCARWSCASEKGEHNRAYISQCEIVFTCCNTLHLSQLAELINDRSGSQLSCFVSPALEIVICYNNRLGGSK